MVGVSDVYAGAVTAGMAQATWPVSPAGLEVGMVENAMLTGPEAVKTVPGEGLLSRMNITDEFGPVVNALEKGFKSRGLDTAVLNVKTSVFDLPGVAITLGSYPRSLYLEVADKVAEELRVAVRFDPTDAAFQRFKEAFYRTNAGRELAAAGVAAGYDGPKLSFEERYEVLKRIGGGGEAIVYKVRDKQTGAICVARRTKDPEELEKLRDEAQALLNVNHPNIVRVHDVLVEVDPKWKTEEFILITEFVEGANLSDLIKKGKRFSESELASMRDQLMSALQEAHTKGIIHRDIKPSNVMAVLQEDGTLKFTLIDFGLAKFAGRSTRTRSMGKGTIYYMAPEQIFGLPITPATDIHGLGLTLLAMMRGKERSDDIRHQKPADDIARLRAVSPAYLSAEFIDALETMLDEDPRKRLKPVESDGEVRQAQVQTGPLDFNSWVVQKVFGGSVGGSLVQGGGILVGSGGALELAVQSYSLGGTHLALGIGFYFGGRGMKKGNSFFEAAGGELIMGGLFALNSITQVINNNPILATMGGACGMVWLWLGASRWLKEKKPAGQ